MYSQRIDAINNEGIIICCRPYVDFETGESKLREVALKYDRSQLMHLTDEQSSYELNRRLRELDAEDIIKHHKRQFRKEKNGKY